MLHCDGPDQLVGETVDMRLVASLPRSPTCSHPGPGIRHLLGNIQVPPLMSTYGHHVNLLSRYWLVLTFVFLTELFMDQLNLSPSFTLLKLVIMFWFVAPIENNGSHILYEKVPNKIMVVIECFMLLDYISILQSL